MRRLVLPLASVLVFLPGCQSAASTVATPLVSCADAQFEGSRARLAADVDVPPEPVGGQRAVQERVRIPREGPRIATLDGRFVDLRAVIDTTGAVRCSDVLHAETEAKGLAVRRAVHASPFEPGRHEGVLTDVIVDLRLDVRGEGTPRVVRGDQIGL